MHIAHSPLVSTLLSLNQLAIILPDSYGSQSGFTNFLHIFADFFRATRGFIIPFS